MPRRRASPTLIMLVIAIVLIAVVARGGNSPVTVGIIVGAAIAVAVLYLVRGRRV